MGASRVEAVGYCGVMGEGYLTSRRGLFPGTWMGVARNAPGELRQLAGV